MRRSYFFALMIVFALGLTLVGCKGKKKAESSETSADGKAAVEKAEVNGGDFTLKDQDGNEVSLSDYKGRIVVLEWMNYDCPFVVPRYEKGDFKKMHEKFAGNDIVWLAVNSTHYSTAKANKDFIEKYTVPYPILDDHKGKVGRMYGATNTPQVFLINKEGQIVYRGAPDNAHRGDVPDDYQPYLENALNELLGGKEISEASTKPIGCTVKYAKKR